MTISKTFSSFSSAQRAIIALFAVFLAIALALLTQSIYPSIAILGVSSIFIFVHNPKFVLSLIGFCYPMIFIVIEPVYSIFFASFYASVLMCGIVLFMLTLKKRISLNFGYYTPLLIVILIGAIASNIIGDSKLPLYRTILAEYFMCISIFAGSFLILGPKVQFDYFIKPFLSSLTILSILLLIQFFFDYEIVYNFSKGLLNRSRLYYGEGASLNMLVNLYLFALPILFLKMLIVGRKSKQFNATYLMLFLINFIPFFLFQSRSSYLGLVIGLGLAIIFFKPIRISWKTTLVGSTLLILLYIISDNMQQFLIMDRLANNAANKDAGMRLNQAEAVLRLLFDYPFGIDRETYYDLIVTYGGFKMSPHNLILDGMLKIGFIGMSGYLTLVVYTLYRLWKIRSFSVSPNFKGLTSAFFAAFTAYLIHNTVHNPGYQFETWVFLGLAAAMTTPAMLGKYEAR